MSLRFHVKVDGKVEGPFTSGEVEDLHGAKLINRDSPCKPEFENDWKTVDDHVPTAKWVTSPRNAPPKLAFQRFVHHSDPSREPTFSNFWEFIRGDGSPARNAVIAGAACVLLQNVCSQLIQGYLLGLGAILSGIIAIVLGNIRSGIIILIAVAATFFLWESLLAHSVKRSIDELNGQMERETQQLRQMFQR